MADSVLTTIAEAVRTGLDGAAFSMTFDPVREYFPNLKRENLTNCQVIVMERDEQEKLDARNRVAMDYLIFVGVVRAITPGDKTTVQALRKLVDEIKRYLSANSFGGASWVATNGSPIYDQARLHVDNEFRSGLIVTYRSSRVLAFP